MTKYENDGIHSFDPMLWICIKCGITRKEFMIRKNFEDDPEVKVCPAVSKFDPPADEPVFSNTNNR